MNKSNEKKIIKVTNDINNFIIKTNELHQKSIEGGKKAVKLGSKSQVDYWVVQFKVTDDYIKKANEMLGQLEIAKYSSEMNKTASEFLNCMLSLSKQISRVFKVTSFKDTFNSILNDTKQAKLDIANEKNNSLIDETTDHFKSLEEDMVKDSNQVELSDDEKNKIIKIFNSNDNLNNDLIKKIFG